MPCTPIPGGYACSRGRRRKPCKVVGCTSDASKLCDYPVTRAGKAATCDFDMCARHATKVGPDRDYCPPHAALAAKAPAQGKLL